MNFQINIYTIKYLWDETRGETRERDKELVWIDGKVRKYNKTEKNNNPVKILFSWKEKILYSHWIPCQQVGTNLILAISSDLFCIWNRTLSNSLQKIGLSISWFVKRCLLTLVKLLIQTWFNSKWCNLQKTYCDSSLKRNLISQVSWKLGCTSCVVRQTHIK